MTVEEILDGSACRVRLKRTPTHQAADLIGRIPATPISQTIEELYGLCFTTLALRNT